MEKLKNTRKSSWQQLKDSHAKIVAELRGDIQALLHGDAMAKTEVRAKHGFMDSLLAAVTFGIRREAEYAHGLLNKISDQKDPVPIDEKIEAAVKFLYEKFIDANVLFLNSKDFNDFQVWCAKSSINTFKEFPIDIFTYRGMTMKVMRSSNSFSFIASCAVKDDSKTYHNKNIFFKLETLEEI